MACSWLRVRREAIEGLTQDALAEALGVEKRVIGSLERCEVRAPKYPDYARLAEELNVSVHELAEAHAHDLAMAGQQERADHARKVAADAWRRQGFNNIDVRKLQQALAACTPAPATTDAPPARSLIQRIADRPAGLPADAADQADHIADLLAQDRMDDLFNLTRIPLREAIAAATDDRLLDALRGFLTAVAQQCAAEDQRLAAGGAWHRLPEDTPAWTIRALIDRSCGLDGLRLVRPAPAEEGDCLDDGADSTRAVRSGPVTQARATARLRELVFGIGELLPTVKRQQPAAGDEAGFDDYCAVVNRQLRLHNGDHDHVFGLWSRATMEAAEVKDALLLRLPNLRLFELEVGIGQRPLLRVEREGLETWLAAHFRLILERRRYLGAHPADRSLPNPNKESLPMHESARQPSAQPSGINIYGDVASLATGDRSSAVQARDQATVNQINASDTDRRLQEALEQLLAGTDAGNPGHVPLRRAVVDIQGDLAETGGVTPKSRERFRLAHAKEGLSLTEQAFSVAANVAALIGLSGIAA